MTTRLLVLPLIVAAGVLAGCASRPPLPSVQPAPGAPAAPRAAEAGVSLPSEQKRLAELFRNTPVVFEMTPEGLMRVEVPLKYSFDKGRSAVKPPLAKVLDYLVPSAKSPGMKTRVSASGDGTATGTLARDRAGAARDYLVGKGVPAAAFTGVATNADSTVEILVGRL